MPSWVDGAKPTEPPITAEALAEKPTRARRSRIAKTEEPKAEAVEAEAEEPEAEEPDTLEEPDAQEPTADGAAEAPKPKKALGAACAGRRRKKAGRGHGGGSASAQAEAADNGQPADAPVLIHPSTRRSVATRPRPAEQPAAPTEGEVWKPKKKTRAADPAADGAAANLPPPSPTAQAPREKRPRSQKNRW